MTTLKRFLTLFLIATLTLSVWGAGSETLGTYNFTNGTTMPTNVTNHGGVAFSTTRFCFDGANDNIVIEPTIPGTATTLYIQVKGMMNSTTADPGVIGIYGLKSNGDAIAGASGTYTQSRASASNASQVDAKSVDETEISFSATNVAKIKINCDTYSKKYLIRTVTITYNEGAGCDKHVNITNANLTTTTTHGSFTLDKNGEQASCDGDVTVNITMTPDAGYYASAVSAPNSSSRVDNGNGTWTVTYAQNTNASSEIGVTFSAIPKYTVTFEKGSGICTTPSLTEASAGAGVELPTATHSCVDWTLAGWAETSVGTETTVKPTLYAAGSIYHPTSNRSLYAVYKRTEGGGSGLEQAFNFEAIAGEEDWINGTAYTSVTLGIVTLTAIGGGNNGKYYTSDNTWRMYSGGTVSISVTGGEVTAVSSNPSRDFTITAGEATYEPSATTQFKSITVTYSAGTTYYHSTPSCTGLQVTPTSLDFGTKNISTNTNLTVTVTGTELTADASLSISGANAGMFSVSPTSLPINGSGEITGSNNITVTYSPTLEGSHSATLNITSGSFNKTVTLSGTCALVCTTPTLTFGGTSSVEKVLGSGKFTIAASSPDNTLGATISYSSDNTSKATVDPSTGEVTLVQATGSGSPVTITATLAYKSTGAACQNEVTASYTLTIYNKVTWLVNDEEYTTGTPTTQVLQGGQISQLPTNPNGASVCGGKTFIGWTTSAVIDPVDVAPTPMYKTVSDMSSVYIDDNVEYYAVFAATSSGSGTGNYLLVDSDPGAANWAGDYLIAYDATTFADGRIGGTGTGGIGEQYVSVNPGTNLSGTVVDGTWGDTYNVTISKIGSTNTYLLQTKDGKYNYRTANSNGLDCSANASTADDYPLTIEFQSADDIEIIVPAGPVFHYNPSGYFRFYKSGGQEAIYLYKKDGGGTTYSDYSTVCGTCLPAPTSPVVTPKSNRATITWTAVPDATGYTVACTGGVVSVVGTTATITGLTSETSYEFTIRSQGSDPYSCFPAYHGSFTTTACEDSPILGVVAVTPTTATIPWTCEAATATIRIYSDDACTSQVGTDYTSCTSPYTISTLTSNTTYYYRVLAGGTCASIVGSFTTEEISLDIAEWKTDAVVVSFNGDADLTLTTFTEETHGDPHANVADDIFFSKYFEAAANVKLLAIFNGTLSTVNLSDYQLGLAQAGKGTTRPTGEDADKWNFKYKKFSEIVKKSGGNLTADELELESNEELILITYTAASEDDEIISCARDDEENSKFSTYIRISSPELQFNGDDAIMLLNPDGDPIDLIGAGTKAGGMTRSGASFQYFSSGYNHNGFMDQPGGWYTTQGYQANSDNTETSGYALSTNRCLLIRRKFVKSGHAAVALNTTDFVTLSAYSYDSDEDGTPENYEAEWKGVQIPGSTTVYPYAAMSNSCTGFAVVGGYNYNDYYIDFDPVGGATTFDDLKSNPFDGTYEIPVAALYDKACTMVRIELRDGSDNLVIRKDVKVPIMITGNKNTTDEIFHTHYKDATICRACDVVVLSDGKLTKAADGTTNDIDEVRDLKIYPGGKLVVPSGAGYNYTVNSLAFRRQEDAVAMADIQGGLDINKTNAVYLDVRIDPTNWHYFTLPYDCNVSDITFSTGDPAVLGTDYLLKWYNGEKRAATQAGGCWEMVGASSVLKKGIGYIVALPGDNIIKKELRFPMANAVIADDKTNKTIAGVYGYGCDKDYTQVRANHRGWNLIGNPYFLPYSSDIENPVLRGEIVEDHSVDPWDGHYKFNDPVNDLRYIVEPVNNGWSEYRQVTLADYSMTPFTCYFVQIGGTNPAAEQGILLDQGQVTGRSSIVRRKRAEYEEVEDTHPVWCAVDLINSKDEKDETTLLISNDFTDEYDMMSDLVKMRGDYYQYAQITTKPVLASRNNEGEMAFNALPDASAETGVPLNFFSAYSGSYTIAYNDKFDRENEVKEVKLFDKTTNQWYDLMNEPYEFSTGRENNTTRFILSVRVERKKTPQIATDIENIGSSDGPRKLLINGHVYIQRGNRIYDITGKQAVLQ